VDGARAIAVIFGLFAFAGGALAFSQVLAGRPGREPWTRYLHEFAWVFALVIPVWAGLETALGVGVGLVVWSELQRALRRVTRAAAWVALAPAIWAGVGLAALCRGPEGLQRLVLVYACTEMTDSLAYIVGGRLGRVPLAPRISPDKSVEGVAAGVVAGLCTGGLLGPWLLGFAVPHGVALGLLLAAGAVAADLGTSWVKRRLGLKDFAGWAPHHGSLTDAYDSLLVMALPGLVFCELLTASS